MKFKELKIGDVFTIPSDEDSKYKKTSNIDAEYGINGYCRVFSNNDEVEIYNFQFLAKFKSNSLIPNNLRNERRILRRIPFYFSAFGESMNKTLYYDETDNIVVSADSFYII